MATGLWTIVGTLVVGAGFVLVYTFKGMLERVR